MTYRWTVFRFATSRRWVIWHLFCLTMVVGMIMAGVWQWGVAFDSVDANGQASLNARNLVYALQWWVFAAFGIWFWFRFLRDQRDAELAELVEAAGAAPEQTHDLSGASATGLAKTPDVISLDDSAEARRARSRQQFNGASGSQESNSDTDAGVEGNRS